MRKESSIVTRQQEEELHHLSPVVALDGSLLLPCRHRMWHFLVALKPSGKHPTRVQNCHHILRKHFVFFLRYSFKIYHYVVVFTKGDGTRNCLQRTYIKLILFVILIHAVHFYMSLHVASYEAMTFTWFSTSLGFTEKLGLIQQSRNNFDACSYQMRFNIGIQALMGNLQALADS